jgi:LysM repeat protein
MNNPSPSPLIPQGSLVEQKNKGRARFKQAVFLVLSIHGAGLLALLMQSCGKAPEPNNEQTELQPTNPPPSIVEQTNPAPPPTTSFTSLPPTGVGTTPPPGIEPAPGRPTEYKVASGDVPVTIAKKFNISVQALLDANPGLEPTKLKIGQPLHIPAPTAAAPTAARGSVATPPGVEAAGGSQIYSVKSGDNLTKIATQFGVTLRALRTANNLSTDRLTVGQKLKIPGKAPASAATGTSVPTDSVPTPPPGAAR